MAKQSKSGQDKVRRDGADVDIVADLMTENELKGRSRDHIVLFDNGDIMDHNGRVFEAHDNDGQVIIPNLGGKKMLVTHRSKLWKYIGDGSKHFWKHGRAVNPPNRRVVEAG